MKYINYFILILLLTTLFFLKDDLHLSTNLLSLFTSKENTHKIEIANKLGYSREMLITVKGFGDDSKEEVNKIVHELKQFKEIKSVQSSLVPPLAIQNYYRENYPILADFQVQTLTQDDIHKKLQTAYDKILNSFFYTSINKQDPLSLFTLHQMHNMKYSQKNSMMTLGKYGYLIRVQCAISASNMSEAKILYDKVHKTLDKYKNVTAFAPFFYTVENSNAFKTDVQLIAIISTLVLLAIYYLLLRNIKLLSETLVALGSSMLFATIIATTFFDNFNILSLAFGMSLTAVSIDYLLHYYFHNFYSSKQKIDKNVLYGFLTTITAFAILSFIHIPLIAQISFFAFLSLSFAYFLFTFVFPYIYIKRYEETPQKNLQEKYLSTSSKTIFLLSISLLIYSVFTFKLDSNIRHLDYQNTSLMAAEKLFKENIHTTLKPVIVKAKSKEELLTNLHILKENVKTSFSFASFVPTITQCKERKTQLQQYDFKSLKSMINQEGDKVGFKKGYFHDAYNFTKDLPDCTIVDLTIFKDFSLNIYNDKKEFYTIAMIDDMQVAKKLPFISSIDIKQMFLDSVNGMYRQLVIFGIVVLSMIVLLLFLSVKNNILLAFNYILFPFALSMAFLTTFYSINIMHLFSFIILIAIGIDYGIYMSNATKKSNTMTAIKYSLLSTFGAFGVLIFSTIVALKSIGIVISLGCMAIFILIEVME